MKKTSSHLPPKPARHSTRSGQVLVIVVLFVALVLLAFMSMGMDFPLIYHAKAKLSRTMDSMALRIVNKYRNTDTQADRERVAQSMFVANYSLLSQNISWSWSGSGSITNASGETLIGIGSDSTGKILYKLTVNTKADSATGVVVSHVSADVLHKTLFLSFFSSSYEEMTFSDEAEAERFPSLNAIIIDLSGSMRGNNGALGIVGTGTTDGAVVQFVKEFDENRDYMLLAAFSNRGVVLWPPLPTGTDSQTGLPYYKPSKNFLTGINVNGTNVNIEDVIKNTVSFSGYTNGAEGLRVAALNVQRFLDNEPAFQNATVRKKVKVNYVFMTDGANNTYRTYMRGYGYALNDTNPPVLSIHNTFHLEPPIVASSQAVLSTITYSSRNLGSLLGGTTPEDMPGVAACVTANKFGKTSSDRFARSREKKSNTYENWTGLLLKQSDARFSDILLYNKNLDTTSEVNSAGLNTSDYVIEDSNENGSNRRDMTRERSRIRATYWMILPRQVPNSDEFSYFNPARGINYYLAANTNSNPTYYSTLSATSETVSGNTVYYVTRGPNNRKYYFLSQAAYLAYQNRYNTVTNDDVDMTNLLADYFPKGNQYANHSGSFLSGDGSSSIYNVNETRNPYIFLANSNSRRLFVTQRISDYYPTYTFDGNPKQDKLTGTSPTNNGTESSRRYYVFKNGGGWRTDSSISTSEIRPECDFLIGAQAKVLRQHDENDPFKYQSATIYTVRYGTSGNASLLENMTNEDGSQAPWPAENEGAYYNTSASATDLQAAFKDIANRIAVRISK